MPNGVFDSCKHFPSSHSTPAGHSARADTNKQDQRHLNFQDSGRDSRQAQSVRGWRHCGCAAECVHSKDDSFIQTQRFSKLSSFTCSVHNLSCHHISHCCAFFSEMSVAFDIRVSHFCISRHCFLQHLHLCQFRQLQHAQFMTCLVSHLCFAHLHCFLWHLHLCRFRQLSHVHFTTCLVVASCVAALSFPKCLLVSTFVSWILSLLGAACCGICIRVSFIIHRMLSSQLVLLLHLALPRSAVAAAPLIIACSVAFNIRVSHTCISRHCFLWHLHLCRFRQSPHVDFATFLVVASRVAALSVIPCFSFPLLLCTHPRGASKTEPTQPAL